MNNFIDQVSIDCVVFGYHSKSLKVLISKIALVEDTFALPGGFIHQNEDIDEAAQRILRERTSINKIYLEQFKVFGNSNRGDDQFISKFKESIFYQKHRSDLNIDLEWLKKRFISVGYYAIVDVEKVVLRASEIDERIDWINIDKIPSLIFDHNDIINEA
ncbi:MAG TPA: NUDIX domain-containing protein, partial [Saprospiraceae bacterium]|nr:NUDIX domain-containing protein [Saprospiraceae bacterium]